MWNAIRYNCRSQYHSVAPSFPLNEILDLQLPSKNFFLLSVLSLAKEQLCNPSQKTFCCRGMQEGIWDSCLLHYCSPKAACAPWWLFRALDAATQGGWGALMSPCARPCPHWHRGILVMHWHFKNQNNVLHQIAYSQHCSAPFSQAGTLHWVYALWWLMTSRSYLSILGELNFAPAQSSWGNVAGFHRIVDS